jgi:hypothetical protein
MGTLAERVREQFADADYNMIEEGNSVRVVHVTGSIGFRFTEVNGKVVSEMVSATPQTRMQNQREMDRAMGTSQKGKQG